VTRLPEARKYNHIAGLEEPPEHFLAAHVFQGLGDVLTMTMEYNSAKLWRWNAYTRLGKPQNPAIPPSPPEYTNLVGLRRADLVIFQGDHTNKGAMDFLALVEIKGQNEKGYYADIQRLLDWFPYLDTCPYGLICSFAQTPDASDTIARMETKMRAVGHDWVLGRIARPLGSPNFQTFAAVIKNTHLRPF
jgi:hypothetical protein